MTAVDVTNREGRLIGVARAIESFNNESLVELSDVGDVLRSLEVIFDIEEKEKDLNSKELKALLLGFVGGLAASRLPQLLAEQEAAQLEALEYLDSQPPYTVTDDADDRPAYTGGPTGGVIEGQGTDPDLVSQTGPRPEEEISGK